MRGNPLWQLGLIVLAFLVLGVPVWRLTRPVGAAEASAPAVSAAPTPAANAETLEVTADFAPKAAEFSLNYLDTAILTGKEQATAKGQWQAALPAEGADLVLHVVWPSGGSGVARAARVVVRWPDGRTVEKDFWSSDGAPLDAVLTVPGDGSPVALPGVSAH